MSKSACGIFLLVIGLGLASPFERARAAVSPSVADEDDLARARREQSELVALVKRIAPAFVAVGAGSGVCIRPDGLIVTNEHVAGERKEWSVFFGDGRPPLTAKRLGVDRRGDLCFLQVVGNHKNLPHLALADSSKLLVGERVIALGNPWVLSQDGRPTVTMGIVSAKHHNQGGYTDAIVTDAPVNPGNSGGPLVNLRGEVVGINGKIATRFYKLRYNTGIGFAIPANQIMNYFKTLAGDAVIWHGSLAGVDVYRDGNEMAAGLRVNAVGRFSPADRAGLRYDDVIASVNGIRVSTQQRLEGLIATFPAGTKVAVAVTRDEEPIEMTIELSSVESVVHGIGLETTPTGDGLTLRVSRLEPNGAGENAGLRVGDRITFVDGIPLTDGEQLTRLLSYAYPGKTVTLVVEREGETRLVAVELDGQRAP